MFRASQIRSGKCHLGMKARYWAKQKVQTAFFAGRTGQQLCMVLGLVRDMLIRKQIPERELHLLQFTGCFEVQMVSSCFGSWSSCPKASCILVSSVPGFVQLLVAKKAKSGKVKRGL